MEPLLKIMNAYRKLGRDRVASLHRRLPWQEMADLWRQMDIPETETLHREITHTEADLQALLEGTAIALNQMRASKMSTEDGASIRQFLTEPSSKAGQLYTQQAARPPTTAAPPQPRSAIPQQTDPSAPPPQLQAFTDFPNTELDRPPAPAAPPPGTRVRARLEGLPVVAATDRPPNATRGPRGASLADAPDQPRQPRIVHDAGDPGALLHGVRCGLHRPRGINAPEYRDIAALLNRILEHLPI
ncbi:hypothetical protein NESM_000709700 [Novymonas esmeraldas]|uniref:Uncharacterized protein n=1 Tax=Novymonas esmeraldas TaxID=1808958 RepID=A0AAW0EWS3_9TRYP